MAKPDLFIELGVQEGKCRKLIAAISAALRDRGAVKESREEVPVKFPLREQYTNTESPRASFSGCPLTRTAHVRRSIHHRRKPMPQRTTGRTRPTGSAPRRACPPDSGTAPCLIVWSPQNWASTVLWLNIRISTHIRIVTEDWSQRERIPRDDGRDQCARREHVCDRRDEIHAATFRRATHDVVQRRSNDRGHGRCTSAP